MIQTLKYQNGIKIKTVYSNGIYYTIRLPTPKVTVLLGDAQSLINNLGDLRIK